MNSEGKESVNPMSRNKEVVLVSKTMISGIFLIVVGLLLLAYSISKNGIINNATILSTMTREDLKEGTYVTGTIDTLMVKYNYQAANFSAINQTEVNMLSETEAFTIPFGENNFIRVRISDIGNQYIMKGYRDKADKANVKTYSLVTSTPVEFFGIVKKSESLNLDWYNQDKELLDVEDVIFDMELVEVKKPDPLNYQYVGAALILVGVLLLISRKSRISKVEIPKESYRDTYAKMQEENPTKSNTPDTYYMGENPTWEDNKDAIIERDDERLAEMAEEEPQKPAKKEPAHIGEMDAQEALEAERKARAAAKETASEESAETETSAEDEE